MLSKWSLIDAEEHINPDVVGGIPSSSIVCRLLISSEALIRRVPFGQICDVNGLVGNSQSEPVLEAERVDHNEAIGLRREHERISCG